MELVYTCIIGGGVIQGFFLALLLGGNPKGNRKANLILALLLIVFSLSIIHTLISPDHLYGYIKLIRIREPFILLMGPLIYLYTRTLTQKEFTVTFKTLVHTLPFVLYFFLSVPLSLHPELQAYLKLYNILIWLFIVLHFGLYLFYVTKIIHAHDRVLKNNFSSLGKINLNWLRFFMSICIAVLVVYAVLLIMLLHSDRIIEHFNKIITLVLAGLIYGLGYKGLLQPRVFIAETGDDAGPARLESPAAGESLPVSGAGQETGAADKIKYDRSGLSEEDSRLLSEQLLGFMEKEKPYLDPQLSLDNLAGRLDIPRNHLSQIINGFLGQNFYDFVNQYRVEEVKRLFIDPKSRKYTILALAFDAGFNSKAAFNTIFKKYTGKTPSEYRKNPG